MPAVIFFAGLDLEQKFSFLDGHYLNGKPGNGALMRAGFVKTNPYDASR